MVAAGVPIMHLYLTHQSAHPPRPHDDPFCSPSSETSLSAFLLSRGGHALNNPQLLPHQLAGSFAARLPKMSENAHIILRIQRGSI
jgi:hypothetical protein